MANWSNRIIGHGEESPKALVAKAHPLNWRTHPDYQAEALEIALDKIGWIDSVIVNRTTGRMIDGHLRVKQALAKGVTSVPVSYVELSEDDEKLALATFDPIAALAEADTEMLARINEELDEDLSQFFSEDDWGEIVPPETNEGEDTPPQIDKAAELQAEWGTELGQLWALGEHRLICGDCTDGEVVNRVMGSEGADFVAIDPPYIGREDLFATDGVIDFIRSVNLSYSFVFWPANREFPFDYEAIHIWHKSVPIHPDSKIGNVAGHQFERIYTNGLGKKCTVIREAAIMPNFVSVAGEFVNHPTQKPLRIYIDLLSGLEDTNVVADYYSGSGTTLIACQNLNRKCRAIEIDPGYVAVTLQRFYDHTGIKPELIDG